MSTFWKLRAPRRKQVVKNPPLDDRDYPTRRNDDFENDHDNENYDELLRATHEGTTSTNKDEDTS